MTALASLPTLAVSIAFNPTNLQSLTQTWTDVTAYVRDFTTSSGRQHFLDRIESSTIRLTLDNRTGYFLNGTTNGTGSVIRTRLPIKVTAGWPAVNVTAISGSGTVVTYTAANTYTAGQQIIVQNATTAAFNGVLTVATATATQFTVASTATGTTSTATVAAAYPVFWGLTESAEERTADQLNQDILLTATDNTKYLSLLYMSKPGFYGQYVTSTYDQNYYTLGTTGPNDQLGTNNGSIVGAVDTTQTGALLYSADTCLDLTNGGSSTNIATFNPFGSTQLNTGSIGSMDFWFIGNQTANQTIAAVSWGGTSYYFNVASTGELIAQAAAAYAVPVRSGVLVNDGYWHHIGLTNYTVGGFTYFYLYCDGAYTLINSGSGTQTLFSFGIGAGTALSAYIDQVVIGKPSQTANNPNILNRWAAGKLLSRTIASGDRIAEVLVLAGYGSIVSGALVVPNYTVNDLPWNQSATITSIAGTGTTATATLASNPWTAGQSVFISGNTYSGSITNITWASGVATVNMTASHAYTVGTNVTITGSSVAAYNGTWAVQSVGSTTWTFVSAYSSTPGTGTGGTTSGPSYYNGLFTVATATSTTFTFASTGTKTISGGAASINSTSAFSVQNLQSPVTSSTALDLIQQVTDTDVGAFFQNPDGTFEFDDQAYLYTATKNATPTGANVWSDTSNLAITSIVGTGTTATVTLSTAYNPYTSGQVVVITGNSVSSFNGSFTITSVGTTTFTFASITSATGTGGVATSQTTNYEPSTLQVLRDDADVWTTVKITAQNGTVQTYENTSAEPLYSYSTLTKSNVVSVTNEQALQEAIYLGNLYQSPLPRVGNVELRSETNNGANLAEMLNPYLNDQVLFERASNGASTAGSINSTMVIESIRHDFQADPGYWHTSFTLDPFPKRGQNLSTPTFFMLFDDSTYGTFDTTNEYL